MNINDVIAERFGAYHKINADNAEGVVFDLQVALTQAGLVVDQIYELAVNPVKPRVDEEAVAAVARALLGHLGQMNRTIDGLMDFTVSLRGAQIVPKGARNAASGTTAATAA